MPPLPLLDDERKRNALAVLEPRLAKTHWTAGVRVCAILVPVTGPVPVAVTFRKHKRAPPPQRKRYQDFRHLPIRRAKSFHTECGLTNYKYNEQFLYATIIFKGPVKVRRWQHFLI